MPDKPQAIASSFLAALHGAYTTTPVFICSLPNGDARDREGGEKSLLTRDGAEIEGFVRKHDRKDRGLYFSVGTIKPDAAPDKPGGSRRLKVNVAEILALHADTDFKSILSSPDDALAAIQRLPLPPSILVNSGNGLHSYWLLSEAIQATADTVAMIEALNDQLSDLVGGDRVRDVCRLMRLPGSHNTKDGAFKPVEIVEARYEPRYEIEDLEEMLAQLSPVIKRKPSVQAERNATERNPFLEIAAQFGFKPPLDVEEALAQMAPGNIHNTLLSVSASLMNRGEEIEDIVETLLPEVAKAHGADWNERRARLDEYKIRKMCADWNRKHPEGAERIVEPAPGPRAQARHHEQDDVIREASTGAAVHNLADERTRRSKKSAPGGAKAAKDDDEIPAHVIVGETMLQMLRDRGEDIIFTGKAAYRYRDGLWTMEVDQLAAWLEMQVAGVVDGLGLKNRKSLRSEARAWIQSRPSLWRDDVAFDQHGQIPTRSGLIDPRTLALTPARPEHYCTWRVEAEYDPAATCPTWLEMLGDTFADRHAQAKADVLGVLQEVLGSALLDTKPRGMSRALVLVGGSNYGKSGVLDVFGGLFGDDVNSTGLDQLEGTHGLMAFQTRRPWVLHEAFNQAKWHTSSTVKAIVTGDPVQINVKNGPILTQRVRSPIFWGTNNPPQFKETTLAVVNRLLIVHCKRIFDDRTPVGTALRAQQLGFDRPSNLVLATERAGLLNWALEGMRRALARGAIMQTAETREAGEEMHRDSNLAAGFIADCIEFDMDWRVSTPDFCAAYSAWFAQEKGTDRYIPSNEAIGKAVLALGLPRLAYHPTETRDNKRRYYAGIKLNAEGQEFWKRALTARAFEGKLAATTHEGDEVNTVLPPQWLHRESVKRMRLAAVTVADFEAVTVPTGNCHSGTTVTENGTPSGRATVTEETVTSPVTDQLSPAQAVDPESDPQF